MLCFLLTSDLLVTSTSYEWGYAGGMPASHTFAAIAAIWAGETPAYPVMGLRQRGDAGETPALAGGLEPFAEGGGVFQREVGERRLCFLGLLFEPFHLLPRLLGVGVYLLQRVEVFLGFGELLGIDE